MLQACCNMKENENTRGRGGSQGAESNTPAMTFDPALSSDSMESRSSWRGKLTERSSQEPYNVPPNFVCVWEPLSVVCEQPKHLDAQGPQLNCLSGKLSKDGGESLIYGTLM